MLLRSSIALTCLILAACSPSPRRVVINPGQNTGPGGGGGQTTAGGGGGGNVISPPDNGGGGGTPAASGNPMQVLNQVDGHLTGRGFQRVGPAVRNANMPTGGLVAYAINAQPGACYLAIAIGASGTDLNMIVLDPLGRTAGHNVAQDSTPFVQICPNQAGRHIARLQMARGQGEYYYALYQSSPGADPQLASVLGGGSGAQPQQQSAQIDAQTNQRLAALDEQLSRQRFQRVGAPMGVRLARGDDDQRQINLQQGVCYAFASLGGQGAQDTDLYIANGSGEQVVQDRSTNVDALVRYCPPTSGIYTLRANMYSGEGPVFIAGWMQQQQQQTATQPQENIIATQSSGGGIEEAYALIDADMQARGYESYGDISRGQLGENDTREFEIQLEGGKCYAIVAVGAGSVRNLDLILLGQNGQPVDRDVAEDSRPTVRVCAEESGQYRMQVKMTEGSGNFVYHAYRWPRGTRGPFGLSGLIYVRLAEVTSLLSVEGFEPDANFAPGRGRLRREGQSGRHNLELPSGNCYAVLVVGGDGVVDLDASLSSGRDEVATDGTRNPFPNVRHCATSDERLRLEVEAAGGSGEYFYQVFSRSGG